MPYLYPRRQGSKGAWPRVGSKVRGRGLHVGGGAYCWQGPDPRGPCCCYCGGGCLEGLLTQGGLGGGRNAGQITRSALSGVYNSFPRCIMVNAYFLVRHGHVSVSVSSAVSS